MAALLSTQLDSLRRERDRLEELLMLDANWRTLRVLDARVGAGERIEDLGGPERRAELVQALTSNRIYAARAKLLETIDLLASATQLSAAPPQGTLASSIVLLDAASGDAFRTRVRVKDPGPAEQLSTRAPDPLQLIDGLGRCAVELLNDGGITRFDEIAAWTSADVTSWRNRLEGFVHGTPGFWIEQAACLAAGRATRFSERARRGEYATLVPQPAPEPVRIERAPTAEKAAGTPSAAEPSLPAGSHSAPARYRAGDSAKDLAIDPAEDSKDVASSRQTSQPAPRAVPPAPPATPFSVPVATAIRIELPRTSGGPSPLAALSSARRAGHAPPRPRSTANVGVAHPADRPRTLLQRLKDLREPERFEANAYAAYRGNVEEASVTIVRADDGPTAEVPPTDTPPRETTPASRFLRALTGKARTRDT